MTKPRGRPRGKKLTAAEVAQRRAARVKHGMRAAGPAQGMTPCKRATCPLTWKCEARKHRDSLELGTEACVIFIPQPHELVDRARSVALALAEGDASKYAELVADHFSRLSAILHTRAAEILQGGALEPKELQALTGLADLLGVSADAQKWTPKSQGRKRPGLKAILDLARGTGAAG